MKKFILFGALFTFILILPSLHLNAKETIIWIMRDVAPSTITKGKFKEEGFNDETINIIIKNLHQFHHKKIIANIKRTIKMLESEKNVCTGALFPTPKRKKIAYFSIPQIFIPSHQLITKNKNLKLFKRIIKISNSPLSLEYLIQNHPELKLGLVSGRSYGAQIDSILKKYGKHQNIYYRGGETGGGRALLKMLLEGRLDYIVEYPWLMTYTMEELNKNRELLNTLPFQESAGYIIGCISCSKSELGQQVIQKTNDILRQERPTEYYRKFFEKWLIPSSIKPYREAYENNFLKN